MDRVALNVVRQPDKFISDTCRVIARYFHLPDQRRHAIVQRVTKTPDDEAQQMLDAVIQRFAARHRNIKNVLADHYLQATANMDQLPELSDTKRMLIGAYFTMEYSIESAALFNPSMVPHYDQSNLKPGELRFVMSLRATGEGHVSSIVFRTGVINSRGNVRIDPISPYAYRARPVRDPSYNKKIFHLKLMEMGSFNNVTQQVLNRLNETFTYSDLDKAVEQLRNTRFVPALFEETARNLRWLARSNYQVQFPDACDPSEVVIFPATENESKGIEDARLVKFTEDDGSTVFYGTYTAYNGFKILPQLFETRDFRTFHILTLNGACVQNKGMALFPRKIDDMYYMIGRLDGENLYLMKSDNINFWNEAELLQSPKETWEYVQIGNCGSPLEIDEGWLLLTHGVGPMRQYAIGAMLLDKDDPQKIIAQLQLPLMVPSTAERDGYVPNVVYSCGGLIHNHKLILPYAMSDQAFSFAHIEISQLIEAMTPIQD